MNYGSPWGAAAEQVKEKVELIGFTDLSPSPNFPYVVSLNDKGTDSPWHGEPFPGP